jgi:hypothetical protein
LRDDIDRGRTGDKVRGGDPAAVPLGTDDEAAGTPPTPSRLRQASAQSATIEMRTDQQTRSPGAAWILIVFAVALLVVFSVVWMWTQK